MGAEDHIDVRCLVEDDRLVFLGETATDGDLHSVVFTLDAREMSESSVELVVGVLTHGAGVDDDDIRHLAVGAHVAGGLERAGESLGVVHVHLAPEGAHLVGAHARAPSVECASRVMVEILGGNGEGGRQMRQPPSEFELLGDGEGGRAARVGLDEVDRGLVDGTDERDDALVEQPS